MAIRMIEGFDQYTTSANISLSGAEPGFWTSGNATNGDIQAASRVATGKEYIAAVANQYETTAPLGLSGTTTIIGFWLKQTTVPTGTGHILSFIDTGSVVNAHLMNDGDREPRAASGCDGRRDGVADLYDPANELRTVRRDQDPVERHGRNRRVPDQRCVRGFSHDARHDRWRAGSRIAAASGSGRERPTIPLATSCSMTCTSRTGAVRI